VHPKRVRVTLFEPGPTKSELGSHADPEPERDLIRACRGRAAPHRIARPPLHTSGNRKLAVRAERSGASDEQGHVWTARCGRSGVGDTRLDFHVVVVLDRLGREAWHEPQVCSYSPALSKQ
jgi:hypothetical protein